MPNDIIQGTGGTRKYFKGSEEHANLAGFGISFTGDRD